MNYDRFSDEAGGISQFLWIFNEILKTAELFSVVQTEFRDFYGIFNQILMISELYSMILTEFRDF